MAWYKIGTVAVTSGSTLVTGSGTLWSINVRPGDAFTQDGTKIYEVERLDDATPNTKLYLKSAYTGATASGQAYAVLGLSTVSISTATLASQVSALLNSWQTRETEFTAWQGGSATGGYDSNGNAATGATAGYYPLTDALGAVHYVACPEKLKVGLPGLNADTVDSFHASQTPGANQVPVLDASGRPPAPLAGRVVSTGGTGASYAGQYTKIARVEIASQYGDCFFQLNTALVTGTIGMSWVAQLNCHIKQQNAFGSDPQIELYSLHSIAKMCDFYYVIVQNTPTTIVDIYAQINRTYIQMIGYLSAGSDLQKITFYDNQPFVASLATGVLAPARQILTAEPSGNVLVSGSTPNIATDTLDGNDNKRLQLAAGGAPIITRGAVINMYGNENAALGALSLYAGYTGSEYINFMTGNAAERMRITAGGNVLTGMTSENTTTGNAKLQSSNGIYLGNTANSAASVLDWCEKSSSFTATATGLTASPTAAVIFSRVGKQVTLTLPAISGTSNAGTFGITGVPTSARPSSARIVLIRVQDNGGTIAFGIASVNTDGTIAFGLGATGGTFTASGTKSLYGCDISYQI